MSNTTVAPTEAPTAVDAPETSTPTSPSEPLTTEVPVADAATDEQEETADETKAPTPSPTPKPVTESTDVPTTGPSASPIATAVPMLELNKVGNNGSPGNVYPLGECQADCDDDDECGPGLICFQRRPYDPVPGCLGVDRSENDYCIVDPNAGPTPPPTVSPPPTIAPTTTMAPTSSPQPTLSPTTSARPTMLPSDMPSLVPTEPPSLTPTISSAPTMSAAPTATPTAGPTIEPLEGIRLKLYWEEGYVWQDETIERKCKFWDYGDVRVFSIFVNSTDLFSFFRVYDFGLSWISRNGKMLAWSSYRALS